MKWKEMYNAISKQTKKETDRITHQEWNTAINSLSMQSNNNTLGIKEIFKLIITFQDRLDLFTEESLNKFLNDLEKMNIQNLENLKEQLLLEFREELSKIDPLENYLEKILDALNVDGDISEDN